MNLASQRIAEADAAAEKLLGYVRMAVALALGLSILVAALSPDRPDDAVLLRRLLFGGIGMSAYFALGLLAVLLVRSRRYAPWMAWGAAAADVVLIAWNIYGPIGFSGIQGIYALAFPAAMMVPLVLTFGALRFRADVQIASTVLMTLLIAVIIFAGPSDAPDPGDAPVQLALVFGAPPNAIRLVMILAVGLIVAIAVWRARRLLERVVAEAEARANLTRFLPAGVGGDMSDASLADLRTGRIVETAILFIDIRNFTEKSAAMRPEDVTGFLTRYRQTILTVAEAHHGVVDKFIGDGALVLFGLDRSAQDGASDALSAAEALYRAFEGDVSVGVGVHCGDVFVGAVGDDRRLEFTVLGDAVNIASRIESLTKDIGAPVLASEASISAAGDPAGWRALGTFEVRGQSDPIAVRALEVAGTP